jgi:BolA protein
VIISDEFAKVKLQAARHRMVYALLKDEMDSGGAAGSSGGGIHALQLSTLTPSEAAAKEARQKGAEA